MDIGDKLIIDISGIAHDGSGVGRHEGQAVFVEGALPQETVEATITGLSRTFARAVLSGISTASSWRNKPFCRHYGDCGGCNLQHCSYEGQLIIKQSIVKDAIERIGRFTGVDVQPTAAMDNPFNYRNKSEYKIEKGPNGEIVIGFMRRSSHRCVDLSECWIVPDSDLELLSILRTEMSRRKDLEELGIRHAVVRTGLSGKKMLILVSCMEPCAGHSQLAEALIGKMGPLVSIYHSLNKKDSGEVIGWRNALLKGDERILQEIGGMLFSLSPASFLQVNTSQAEKLYDQVVAWSMTEPKSSILDLYCGIGTMTLLLARHAVEVMGIELNPEAVNDARSNADKNGIANAIFKSGWAEALIRLQELVHSKFEVAVVDPPRTGCDAKVIQSLGESSVRRIVYVSCNPATLARDARRLSDLGFSLTKVQPVDMFPHTSNIEVVCMFERQ